MALIRQYHRDTNTTYVYSSESYWDPEKQQSRSRRKVVGKIDPNTGEMIPTGKRGRKKKEATVHTGDTDNTELKRITSLYEEATKVLAESNRAAEGQKAEIAALRKELSALKEENRALKKSIKKIQAITEAAPL